MAPAASLFGPDYQWFDDEGLPLAGGFVYFYQAGSSTPLDTFSDSDLTPGQENPNPIELNAAGRSTPPIYVEAASYKIIVKNSVGTTIWTRDNQAIATPF